MKKFCKRFLTLIVCFLFIFVNKVNAASGVRHYSDELGNIYLGGNYIEVGINSGGVFGTTAAPKDEWGFHFISGKTDNSGKYYLGLLTDGDGWDVGDAPTLGDFFTPGNPEERWVFSYEIDGVVKDFNSSNDSKLSASSSGVKSFKVEDKSSGNTLKAVITLVSTDNVEMVMTYTFDVNDIEYDTEVVITNKGTKKITKAGFSRGFDPDQDKWFNNTYETYNKVASNPVLTKAGGTDNFAMVVARGPVTLGGVFFLSFDNRARVSLGGSYMGSALSSSVWENAPVTKQSYADADTVALSKTNTNGYHLEDNNIAINTRFGEIDVNGSDKTNFVTSLDPNVERSLSKVTGASGNAEMDRIIVDAEEGQYYALFDGDTLVKPWTNEANEHGQIIFDGLTPGKTYTVKTVTEDHFNTSTNKPSEDAEVAESEMKTLFDPTDTSEEETTINSTRTTIKLDGLNEDYTYALVDESGSVIKDYVSPTDGEVVFEGLTKNTKYYLVSKDPDGHKSGKVEVSTMNNYVDLSVKKEGTKTPDSKIVSDPSHVFDVVLTDEEKETDKDINVYLTVKDISDEISEEDKLKFSEKAVKGTKIFYVDLSLYKQIGSDEPIQLDSTSSKIKIAIDIPEELVSKDSKMIRNYTVYRLHNGEVEKLKTYLENGKIIIETDKFSEYAITYEDVKNPKTGVNTVSNIVLFLVSIIGLVLLAIFRKVYDYKF